MKLFQGRINRRTTGVILFLGILLLGTFARAWGFRSLPPGLNQDEASIGLEAYDLLHYGVDRNGVSYPVNFVSWGNGMDALYGYVLIPFVAFGLSPLTVRLPSLLLGLATMPLVFYIGKRSLGTAGGLVAMFLLAISPWHILLSRTGLNENIVPFVFGLGVACMLKSRPGTSWFAGGTFCLGLALYAYGAMYVAVPVFLVIAVPLLVHSGRVARGTLLLGLGIFAALAVPILLFVLVNSSGWSSLHLGLLTVPRLPAPARFLGMAATSSPNLFSTVGENAWTLLSLLLVHPSDGIVWNVVEPFGYLYAFSFPLAVAGAALMWKEGEADTRPERLLVLTWLVAGLCIGLAQSANINRMDLIFVPIILCTAACLIWLGRHSRLVLGVLIAAYLISFAAFQAAYHGSEYRARADQAFFAGLLPALDFASAQGNPTVCVTDHVEMPYIYVLFSQHPDPRLYLPNIRYVDPSADFRAVLALDKYSFGVQNCRPQPGTVYVLSDEAAPDNGLQYKVHRFTNFRVYSPP